MRDVTLRYALRSLLFFSLTRIIRLAVKARDTSAEAESRSECCRRRCTSAMSFWVTIPSFQNKASPGGETVVLYCCDVGVQAADGALLRQWPR